VRGGATVGQVRLGRQHVVELGDLEGDIVDDGEIRGGTGELFDVRLPFLVVRNVVHRNTDDLGVALLELARELRDGAELGRAHRGEVFGMGEQDGVAVAQPFMEIDLPRRGVSREIGCRVVDAKCHGFVPSLVVGPDRPV
jgi:hypothetical protein